MIKKYLETEVLRLLGTGKHSLREIARRTGVSRGTVSNIASGKQTIKSRKGEINLSDDGLLPSSEDPPRRCPDCGAMVFMPCRSCEVKALAAKKEKRPFDRHGPELVLGLNLKPAHQERYEEVRRWRRENLFVGSMDGAVERVC